MTQIIQKARRRGYLAFVALIASSGLVAVIPALPVAATGCPTANTLDASSVGGGHSNFEIDAAIADSTKLGAHAGANLTLDGGSTCIDWSTKVAGVGTGTSADATTGVIIKPDLPSGTGDDSFTQGTSENATDPVIATGSIPPNKSDLQDFGVYKETNSSGKFLNLFWSRINSPSGTVDMDFELNKVACDGTAATCSNNAPKGTNYSIPLRSSGDKLVTYDLANGGTVPTISIYTWSGNSTSGSWANGTVISGGLGEALGSINFSSIASKDSVGLGTKDPLTFGEASISFKALFGSGGSCGAFGSVYLKSRSSNTFTDELKDFSLPQPGSLTNCTGLTTNATAGPVTIGGSISDTATLSGASGPTGTMTFNAYSNAACTTSVFSISTTTLVGPDGSGNFTASSGNFTPLAAGTYYWIASYGNDPNNAPATTKCLDANESSVIAPKQPGIVTTAGSATTFGNTVSDSATLSNTALEPDGVTKAQGSITFKLFGPSASPSCTNTNLVFTSSPFAVNGDGPYGPTSVTPTTAGTYYWIASYTGDLPNTKSATTACGDTGETSTVPPATPAISTTATAGPVVVTTALDDTAHLSGTVPEPGGVTPAKGTITFTLYGPELSTSVCSTTLATRVVNVSGNGDYVASSGSTGTGSLTPIVPGIYNWIAVYSGDLPNDPGVSTACGDANESTTVIQLPSTIQTSQFWTPQDSATVTGGGTGSVTFNLYKNDPTCTSSGAVVYGPDVEPLNISGVASTNNTIFSVSSVGTSGDTYYWGVSYPGDATHKPVSSCVEYTGFSSLNNGGPVTSP